MKILTSILIIYLSVAAYLFFLQRNFIYFPTPEITHPYPEISYSLDTAVVKVVVLNKENKKAILYFGGNGEAVERTALEFGQRYSNQAIYLVKYRGYGGSTGKPTEEKLYSDALNVFDDLSKQHTEISVIGRSLGSGIATYLASKRNIQKLVLVTPFDSAESVAQKSFPIFPMFILLKDKYDSVSRVGEIEAKTLLLVAENDNIIKKHHSIKLAKSFHLTKPKMVVIANTGHNTISSNPEYIEILSQFLNADF